MFGSDEAHKMIKPNSRRRVLKPPGGGSSDIFGAAAEPAEPQRKNTSHLTSSIFGGEDTVTPARKKAGNDSFYNLFGTEPHFRPVSAVKDKFISSMVSDQNKERDATEKSVNFSDKDANIKVDLAKAITTTRIESIETNDSCCETNGLEKTNGSLFDDLEETFAESESPVVRDESPTKPDVNPVVNEAPSVNGSSSTNSAASTTAPTPTANSAPATAKPRIPPGGFSSGLW